MKYSIDTYRLYFDEKVFSIAIRVKVTMKEEVDADILRRSVNTAIKRYPYFSVEVRLGRDGGYELIPNKKEIVVIRTSQSLPDLSSAEVNHHLVFLDCEGRDIYFNISHSLGGGRGVIPFVMTTI